MVSRLLPPCLVLVALAMAVAHPARGASTSGTVVGANVPSATSLDVSGCEPDLPGITDFGSVTAGSSNVTSSDCVVTFGSSNAMATLRIQQEDALGAAMFQELGGNGALDPDFGGGAPVTTGLTVDHGVSAGTSGGLGRQSDGRLVVAGVTGSSQVRVRRYQVDGSLDTSFGSAGSRTFQVCSFGSEDVAAMVVDTDDSIYIAGEASCSIGAYAMRLTADGDIDLAYGGNGDGIARASYVSDIRDAALMPDGRLVIAGGGREVILFERDGSTAADFGDGDGVEVLPSSTIGTIRGVAALPDGRIVVSGYRHWGTERSTVARLEADGDLDFTFGGGDGWAANSAHPTTMEGREVTIAPDGSIFVAAYQGIVKFTSSGVLDSSFGTNGTFDLQAVSPGLDLNGVTMLRDGSLIGFGRGTNAVAVVKVLPGGTLDTSFGTDGVVTVPGVFVSANDAVWAHDGDLVTFGAQGLLVQLDGLAIADHGAGGDWSAGSNSFGACLAGVAAGASALWNSDGSCTAANDDDWYAVPTSPTAIAHTTVTATQAAEARLRFGLRTASGQRAGRYVAPIAFTVVAP